MAADLGLGVRVPGVRRGRQLVGVRLGVVAVAVGVRGGLVVAARRGLPGLDPRRADVIYAGAEILHRVALRAQALRPQDPLCDHVVVSDRGVRWGVLEELA